MTQASIEISCVWFDSDVLELQVKASNGVFVGVAHPYVDHDSFAAAVDLLAGFPQSITDRRELKFGDTGMETAGGFVQLVFSCRDGAGHAALEVLVESKNESRSVPRWATRSQVAHFFAEVEPAAIDAFTKDLRALNADKMRSALLVVLPG